MTLEAPKNDRGRRINDQAGKPTKFPKNRAGKPTSKITAPRDDTITPRQLADLKKGPKVNIIVGSDDQRYIGVEGAFVSVLTHFSKYAKTKLVNEANSVFLIPGSLKVMVVWIYKYMRAGQKDPDDLQKLQDMGYDQLISLYAHCATLEYEHLQNRTLAQIRGTLLHGPIPSPSTIRNILDYVLPAKDAAVEAVACAMLQPLHLDYSAYERHLADDKDFSAILSKATEKMLQQRTKAAEKNHNQPAPTANTVKPKTHFVRVPFKCHTCIKEGHSYRKCPDKPAPNPSTCYTCHEVGHKARTCPYAYDPEPESTPKPKPKPAREAPVCYCYSCRGLGHIAHNCTSRIEFVGANEDSAPTKFGPRNPQARNRDPRRAPNKKRYPRRIIHIATNGEGTTTCDREVRSGEYTRLGLKI